MNKFEYIAKTLSRTKRKDFENYVINRIYNDLNDYDIKPVSQQYVRRPNGKYALIDLYFPQLNIGIECDEIHHLNHKEEDNLRFTDIINSISSYEEIRIPIFNSNDKNQYRSIEGINNDINNAVNRIREKKSQTTDFEPWDTRPDIYKALEKGLLDIDDNYIFTQEELRLFFDRSGITQKCFYKIIEDCYIWLPGLAIENEGNYIPYNKNLDYINIISKDGEKIFEFLPDIKENKNEVFKRIVFVKMKDRILNRQVYKFAGVFEKKNKIMHLNINNEEKPFVVHYRKGKKITKLSKNNYSISN
ncbi:MAG: hypothetical protein KHZ80_08890 [Anaerococcus vaginalis]|uniref:AbaSI family restriction endonuclease n=1 Tax=Anaerococcus vaginalis TaxID=33037 RepID=UPI001D4941BB|nr:hypothetical protein [Anaerococcus vaginalis]MBS4890132.1 hypothetical protein [Anaerococcus vaginalis]